MGATESEFNLVEIYGEFEGAVQQWYSKLSWKRSASGSHLNHGDPKSPTLPKRSMSGLSRSSSTVARRPGSATLSTLMEGNWGERPGTADSGADQHVVQTPVNASGHIIASAPTPPSPPGTCEPEFPPPDSGMARLPEWQGLQAPENGLGLGMPPGSIPEAPEPEVLEVIA